MNEIIREMPATFKVRNQEVEVVSEFRYDLDDQERVPDEHLDSIGQELAVDEYRKQNDILSSQEVKDIRGRYGLSQRSFAKLIGIGVATIARYESGQMPTKANNELLKSFDSNKQLVSDLFESNRELLSEKDQAKVEAVIGKKKGFDKGKVKALVVFYAQEIEFLSKTRLDEALHRTGKMTGLKFVKSSVGHEPKDADYMYADLRKAGAIDWHVRPDGNGDYIQALIECKLELFTEEEMEIMINVVDEIA